MARARVRLDGSKPQKWKEQVRRCGDSTRMGLLFRSCAKAPAARLRTVAIKRTPVGQYPAGSGKAGGALEHSWTAGWDFPAKSYANSPFVDETGGDNGVAIADSGEPAPCVAFRYRASRHMGWAKGRSVMAISEEIRKAAPRSLEQRPETHWKGCFN